MADIVGDQLTGLSSAMVYCRQLLQVSSRTTHIPSRPQRLCAHCQRTRPSALERRWVSLLALITILPDWLRAADIWKLIVGMAFNSPLSPTVSPCPRRTPSMDETKSHAPRWIPHAATTSAERVDTVLFASQGTRSAPS
jgi:hypothetical protein